MTLRQQSSEKVSDLDYLRLRDGWVSGGSDQDPRSVLDYGRQAVPLDQRLRGNAIPSVWFDDLNWA